MPNATVKSQTPASAENLVLLSETAQRGLFVGEFLKYLREMGNFEDFFHFWRQSNDLHRAALLHNGHINARQFAYTRAVQIVQLTKVQQNVVAPFAQQRLHRVAQRAYFKKG